MKTKQFEKILKFLNDLHNEGFEFDDNTLLDCTTKIYNTQIINESKFVYSKSGQGSPKTISTSSKNPAPATKGQIDYLCKNNIDHNAETITKKEAWKIINDHKENGNSKQEY